MKRWRSIGLAALCVTLLAVVPATADTYSGTLNVGADSTDELEGTASWGDGPSSLSYVVSQNPDLTWHYEYTLSVPEAGISHFILELTPGALVGDFTYDVVAGENTWTDDFYTTHNSGPGNPNMPEAVYGVKWEWNAVDGGITEVFSFDSTRVPVWQDFYAKCGGQNVNTIWNTGFTAGDTDPDDPYWSTEVTDHVLGPNGYVPEPATTVLFGIGLAGLVGRKLRRRREDD
ncbi:MAG: PEP-CTERM sorting domain-containing protein [Armatimonadota bacterium]